MADLIERSTPIPKVEILELKDDFVKFILRDTETSLANALRRAMIAEVPTMAIDLVTIYANTSVLQDEFLAHRLGLIPLRIVDPKVTFEYNYDCECEDHCPRCSVEFRLDVSYEEKAAHMEDAMLDARDVPVFVTSEDLKSSDGRVAPVNFSSSEQFDFAQDNGIMIAKLARGQRIQLTAIAKKGIAKEHAKWSPVAVATYQFDPIVEVNEDEEQKLTNDQKQELVECCPTKVYKIDDRTGNVYASTPRDCIYCDDCVQLSRAFKARPEDDPVVTVRPREDCFIFSVETNGSVSAEQVVVSALNVISLKLQSLRNELMNLKDDMQQER